jgi:hypothetical protein
MSWLEVLVGDDPSHVAAQHVIIWVVKVTVAEGHGHSDARFAGQVHRHVCQHAVVAQRLLRTGKVLLERPRTLDLKSIFFIYNLFWRKDCLTAIAQQSQNTYLKTKYFTERFKINYYAFLNLYAHIYTI